MQQLQDIFDDCGLVVGRYETVHGGDINHSYCLYSNGAKYFLKINSAQRFPQMFEREVHGLYALSNNSALKVPSVIKQGAVGGTQYLLLEWIEKDTQPNIKMWYSFGEQLALMHKRPQAHFG